jgi:hypothetical protein
VTSSNAESNQQTQRIPGCDSPRHHVPGQGTRCDHGTRNRRRGSSVAKTRADLNAGTSFIASSTITSRDALEKQGMTVPEFMSEKDHENETVLVKFPLHTKRGLFRVTVVADHDAYE